MSSLVKATSALFDDDNIWVALSDGRVIGVPLARSRPRCALAAHFGRPAV
jgi:hypothetical protein